MAIRAKHVQDEIRRAEEATVNASVVEKVIIRLLTIGLRLLLNVRLNEIKIMEHFNIAKTQPRLPRKEETNGTNDSKVEDVEAK